MPDEKALEVLAQKAEFLEKYQLRTVHGPTEICKSMGFNMRTVNKWIKDDRTFATKMQQIDEERVQVAREIFVRHIEDIAKNIVTLARGRTKNSIKAAHLALEMVGLIGGRGVKVVQSVSVRAGEDKTSIETLEARRAEVVAHLTAAGGVEEADTEEVPAASKTGTDGGAG